MRFMSMRKKSFAKRNGKILEATDINLVTDEEQLGMERFNFSLLPNI
jgi:hypothetical protein